MDVIKVLGDIRFVNVGENPPRPKPGWIGRRQWNACVEYGFLSAGQDVVYNQPLLNLKINDIVAAFITGCGYVGIGMVIEEAIKIKDFLHQGKSLKGLPYVRDTLFDNSDNEKSEFIVRIEWIKTVDKRHAYWRKNYGLFANPSIQSNLKDQPKTIKFLEECFVIDFQ